MLWFKPHPEEIDAVGRVIQWKVPESGWKNLTVSMEIARYRRHQKPIRRYQQHIDSLFIEAQKESLVYRRDDGAVGKGFCTTMWGVNGVPVTPRHFIGHGKLHHIASYMEALHEFGHFFTLKGLSAEERNLSKLDNEVMAWEWAIDNLQEEPLPPDWARGLGWFMTYVDAKIVVGEHQFPKYTVLPHHSQFINQMKERACIS